MTLQADDNYDDYNYCHYNYCYMSLSSIRSLVSPDLPRSRHGPPVASETAGRRTHRTQGGPSVPNRSWRPTGAMDPEGVGA